MCYLLLYANTYSFYTVNYIGSSLMLRYTEGATWTAIVAALVTPLGGIFWFFFQLNPDLETYWNWDNSDLLIILGLVVMAPFIFLYDRETQKQEELEKEQMDYLAMGNEGNGRNKGYRDLEDNSSKGKVVL